MKNEPTLKKFRRSRGEVNQLIAQWEQSGQSKSKFCKEHKIKHTTFHGWIARRKKHASNPPKVISGFVSLKLHKEAHEPFAEINLSNGVCVSLFQSVPAGYLRELFHK